MRPSVFLSVIFRECLDDRHNQDIPQPPQSLFSRGSPSIMIIIASNSPPILPQSPPSSLAISKSKHSIKKAQLNKMQKPSQQAPHHTPYAKLNTNLQLLTRSSTVSIEKRDYEQTIAPSWEKNLRVYLDHTIPTMTLLLGNSEIHLASEFFLFKNENLGWEECTYVIIRANRISEWARCLEGVFSHPTASCMRQMANGGLGSIAGSQN